MLVNKRNFICVYSCSPFWHYQLSFASCEISGGIMNVMRLNHPQASPHPTPNSWKNCLPQNWSLVPKRLGTAALPLISLVAQTYLPTMWQSWVRSLGRDHIHPFRFCQLANNITFPLSGSVSFPGLHVIFSF